MINDEVREPGMYSVQIDTTQDVSLQISVRLFFDISEKEKLRKDL